MKHVVQFDKESLKLFRGIQMAAKNKAKPKNKLGAKPSSKQKRKPRNVAR